MTEQDVSNLFRLFSPSSSPVTFLTRRHLPASDTGKYRVLHIACSLAPSWLHVVGGYGLLAEGFASVSEDVVDQRLTLVSTEATRSRSSAARALYDLDATTLVR
jgi:hypothetical protein